MLQLTWLRRTGSSSCATNTPAFIPAFIQSDINPSMPASAENSALLRYISPLPEKPLYSMPLQGIHYVPDWPVRVNVEHILGDPANVARLPTELQSARNLPLLLETAVELARRKAIVSPGDAVPQIYQQRLQYLLPLCLTDNP